MPGSKTKPMTTSSKPTVTRKAILSAIRKPPHGGDYVWDGTDDEDRPATGDELAAAARKRGRPSGSGTKEQVAIRLDRDLLAQLRATGPGWQTRVNDALRVWLQAPAVPADAERATRVKA